LLNDALYQYLQGAIEYTGYIFLEKNICFLNLMIELKTNKF